MAAAVAEALGSLRVIPVRGPVMGLFLAGRSGVGLGLRVLRWFAYVCPVTDVSGVPYRLSFDGGLSPTPPLSGQRAPAPGPLCVCLCVPPLAGSGGSPLRRVLVHLTLSSGRSRCSPYLLGPLRAGVILLVVVLVLLFLLCAPVVSGILFSPARGALGLGVLGCPPPFFFSSSPPPSFSLPFCCCIFVWVVFFCLPFLCALPWFAGCVLLGWFVCPGLWGVLLCVVVGRFALALCRPVLPACACSRCVVACCVLPVPWHRAGGVSHPRAASGALLVCFVLWSFSAVAYAACRCPFVLWWGCSVAPGLFHAVSPCVGVCFVPLWSAVWCCLPPPRPPPPWVLCAVCFIFSFGCVLVVLPPPPKLVVEPCFVRCCAL